MCGIGHGAEQTHEFGGIKEFDAVIAPEMPSLVVPVVWIGRRIAFLGVTNERSLPLGEFAVRKQVDAFVSH